MITPYKKEAIKSDFIEKKKSLMIISKKKISWKGVNMVVNVVICLCKYLLDVKKLRNPRS